MKKILIFVICNIFIMSMAEAVPHPKHRKQNNARIAAGKTLPPKPPVIRR